MQTDVRQVFYFNASATAVGGVLEGPTRALTTPSSVALPPTGGAATMRAEASSSHNLLGTAGSSTLVTGQPVQRNGPWVQRASAVVEGFSLLDRITADRLVAQVFVEHPAKHGPRRYSFAGSSIDNLRIDGKPIALHWSPTLLPPGAARPDPTLLEAASEPHLTPRDLRGVAYHQVNTLLHNRHTPQWARERFGWMDLPTAEAAPTLSHTPPPFLLCSLVDNSSGLDPQQAFSHCIDIPGLGRIFLGEILIYPDSVTLTMLRAELGCAVSGHASAASVVSNGSTMPPSASGG